MTNSPEITASDKLAQELTIATDASIGVIAIRCPITEVYRVVDEVYALAMAGTIDFRLHTAAEGWQTFQRIDPEDTHAEAFDPLVPQNADKGSAAIGKAFEQLSSGQLPDKGFFVMLDLYFSFGEMQTQTSIRKQAQRSLSNEQRLFLIVPETAELPESIAPLTHVIEFGYPSRNELSTSLDDILDSLDDDDKPKLTDEQRSSILSNGQGMTANSFETACALAITEYGAKNEGLEGFGVPNILNSLRDYKTQLLRKTNVLELQPQIPEDEIGGLDLFKAWMHQRKLTYTDEARAQGVTPSRGALVVGPPGCKAAGTVLHYRRGKRNSARQILIEDFVAKFNGDPVARSKGWDTTKPTYVQSWDAESGAIFYNEVLGAYATGKKKVIDITVSNGVELGITAEDSVLMADGTFTQAKNIKTGDTILSRGSMKPQSQGGRSINRPRVVIEGLKYYDGGWSKTVYDDAGDYTYKRQQRARLTIEARMNGLTYDEYLFHLKNTPDHPFRSVLSTAFDVHHLDEDTLNDNIGNLEVLTKSAHLETHRAQHMENLNVEYTRELTVTAVGNGRVARTYDLQLASPCANFVCENTFIAHNTGKSLVAKAAGSILNLPVIRFDVGRVFGAYVGQSEQSMRSVLGLIDAMAPCVLMLDEIDKGFAGMGGDGGGSDGGHGTTQRVFGTFLTWMQERNQTSRPVFLIMTANRVTGLPPELLRKGRIDEIWSVTLPNWDERGQIVEIHARKRKQQLSKEDMAGAKRITEGFVGAEIEAMIEDAVVISLGGKPGLSFEYLEEAKGYLKPMSRTREAEFSAMRSWAETNARPASSPEASTETAAPLAKGIRGRKPKRVRTRVTRDDETPD